MSTALDGLIVALNADVQALKTAVAVQDQRLAAISKTLDALLDEIDEDDDVPVATVPTPTEADAVAKFVELMPTLIAAAPKLREALAQFRQAPTSSSPPATAVSAIGKGKPEFDPRVSEAVNG